MKRTLFEVMLLSLLPLINASAAGIADLTFEKCDWNLVYTTFSADSSRRQAEISGKTTPLTKEIRALADKATKNNVPIDQQLDKTDLVKLSQLMQRSNSIIAALKLEANRDRDMNVFDHVLQVIDKKYRWYTTSLENSPDAIYQAIINLFPSIIPQDPNEQVTIPSNPTCTIQVALFRFESEATAKLHRISVTEGANRMLNVIQDMAKRYHVENLGQAKLSKEDQKTFDDFNRSFIVPASHEQEFINNIEAVRLLDAASEMIYTTGKQDLADSGGNGRKVGSSLNRKVQNHELPEHMVRAIGLMQLIANKLPPAMQMQDYPEAN